MSYAGASSTLRWMSVTGKVVSYKGREVIGLMISCDLIKNTESQEAHGFGFASRTSVAVSIIEGETLKPDPSLLDALPSNFISAHDRACHRQPQN